MLSAQANAKLIEELLTNHDTFVQEFYNKYNGSILADKTIAKYGRSSHCIVYQAWRDIFKEEDRTKIGIRYIPEGNKTECEQRIKDLSELFLLARAFLRNTQKNMSQQEKVERAITLAEAWKSRKDIPPDEMPEYPNSANLEKLLLQLWIFRCREVYKCLQEEAKGEQRKLESRGINEINASWLYSHPFPNPEEALIRMSENNGYHKMLSYVYRDNIDATICEGKIDDMQTEDRIAEKLNLTRVQVRQRWDQLNDRARFLFLVYTEELPNFPTAAQANPGEVEFLKNSILRQLKQSVLNLTEQETTAAFWIKLQSLSEIILHQSKRPWRSVLNDWRNPMRQLVIPDSSCYKPELRRDLVFSWAIEFFSHQDIYIHDSKIDSSQPNGTHLFDHSCKHIS